MEHQADVHPQLRLIRPDAGPGCEKNGRSATWAVTTRSGRHQVPVAVLPTAKSLSAFSLKPQSDRLLEARRSFGQGDGLFDTADHREAPRPAPAAFYFEKPQTQRDEAIRSATFGARGLIHAAQAMGLGTTPMIGFDPVGVSREFSLSDNEVPALLVAVGYPTEANGPQKPRRPISDVLAFA